MSADIENVLYSDRGLTRYYNERTDESTAGWADIAHESVRAMNHITNSLPAHRQGIPAPITYDVLGNVAGMASMLPQLFAQLADGLARSLDYFEVTDSKQEPSLSVQAAVESLANAGVHAQRLADALEVAQVQINSQSYEEKGENG